MNPDPLAPLTPREREILKLISQGRSNPSICQELWLSPKTVESHVRNIFCKLGPWPSDARHNRRVLAVLTYLEANGRHDVPQAEPHPKIAG